MGRERTGSIYEDKKTGYVYGVITWLDPDGRRRRKKRKAATGTKREARQHIQDLLNEQDEESEEEEEAKEIEVDPDSLDAATITFKQLTDYYEKEYAVEATYDQHGMKTGGLRSYRDTKRKLVGLREQFSGLVSDISYGDLATFKRLRLKTKVEIKKRAGKRKEKKYKTESHGRSIASVHRELALLRRLFSVAVQHRWLMRNPFQDGEPLINPSQESERERIATREERDKLIAACTGPREALRPFLICAFDTGFRGSEMYRLTVSDVNLSENWIRAVSYKGKQRRERYFDMTHRLGEEMYKLCAGKSPEEKIFDFKSVKRSFKTAKKLAGMAEANFRLHDARHTAATRMIQQKISLAETGKLLGHTQSSTTLRYLHIDKATQKEAANALEED